MNLMFLNRPPLEIITLAIAIVKCLVQISVLPDPGCPTEPSLLRGLARTPPEQGLVGHNTRMQQAGRVLATFLRLSASPMAHIKSYLKQTTPLKGQVPPPDPILTRTFSINLET